MMDATGTVPEEHVAELTGQITGSVLRPADANYDAVRACYNGLIDRKPALIVRCRTTQDAVAALAFARREGLEVSIRGAGHNVAGRAVTEGGVMIDLSEMKGIEIDPGQGTATAQGGVVWAELNAAAAEHGLAVTGGVISTTGIAGFTLGGGLGWLMAKYGLASDNVLAVELVTADGEILQVDAASHPDLFWALRGGGGNFGIATSFTYRLHPLGTITGGLIAHPIDAAPELLRFYRDAIAGASDDLSVFAGLVHAPDGSGAKLAALVVFHTGDADQAERDLEPFKTWGSPLVVDVGPMPYPVMNTLLDAAYPTGSLNYWLANFTLLPDELIDIAVARYATVPSPMTAILFEHFHGAVTRIGATDSAVPHRAEAWNLLIPSVWTDPAETDANIEWTRETYAAMRPHFGTGRWLNYLDDDQGDDATVRAAYGPNYERLREVKRRYDPDNVFHLNHNIQP
jgi:FAD/FMN-containing dehydrogenase